MKSLTSFLRFNLTMVNISSRKYGATSSVENPVDYIGNRTASNEIKKRLWNTLRCQANDLKRREPFLTNLVKEAVLDHDSFADALIHRLATKLGGTILPTAFWTELFQSILSSSESKYDHIDIERLALEDLITVEVNDPACRSILQAFLYFKGYKSIQAYRFSHYLWKENRIDLAMSIQSRVTEVFGVDIHPAADIKGGFMIDHGTGVVIGETCVIGENCQLLHGVTLGGNGKEIGDRHPKLGDNVIIGCQATILGNIRIGNNSRIGAASMVLKPVPDGATAVGVPARILSVEDTSTKEKQDPIDEVNEYDAMISKGFIKVWKGFWKPKTWIHCDYQI